MLMTDSTLFQVRRGGASEGQGRQGGLGRRRPRRQGARGGGEEEAEAEEVGEECGQRHRQWRWILAQRLDERGGTLRNCQWTLKVMNHTGCLRSC